MSVKSDVRRMLDLLPDDATFEDVQYHLYVREKIERSIHAADSGQRIPHEQVEAEMRQWLASLNGQA